MPRGTPGMGEILAGRFGQVMHWGGAGGALWQAASLAAATLGPGPMDPGPQAPAPPIPWVAALQPGAVAGICHPGQGRHPLLPALSLPALPGNGPMARFRLGLGPGTAEGGGMQRRHQTLGLCDRMERGHGPLIGGGILGERAGPSWWGDAARLGAWGEAALGLGPLPTAVAACPAQLLVWQCP